MRTNLRKSQLFGALTLGVLTLAVSIALTTAAPPAEGKGKPGGGGSPPPYDKVFHFELLPTFGGNSCIANAINNHGDIVGQASGADGLHAFLSMASDRTLVRLHDFLHDEDKYDEETQSGWKRFHNAYAINDLGQIVGEGAYWEFSIRYGNQPFLLTPDVEGDFYNIQPLSVAPSDINNVGDMVGSFDVGVETRAFVIPAGETEPINLGVLYADQNFSTAKAVNANGQIAGYSGTNPGEFDAFRLTPGEGMIDLGVFKPQRGGYIQGFAYDLNDSGVVVGSASAGGWSRHAFRWDGALKDLGTFGGDTSIGLGINTHGDVVGWAQDNNDIYHAFLYVDGFGLLKVADYTDLPQGSTITNWSTNSITVNDDLVITGNLRDANGILQSFVLTPVEL